jgi:hypothetical protein
MVEQLYNDSSLKGSIKVPGIHTRDENECRWEGILSDIPQHNKYSTI